VRPDAQISVCKHDISPPELPKGTAIANVKYCNDRPACIAAALKPPKMPWDKDDACTE
jgi:hypothetical protein